ncbi:hypothetical protein [Streptococcus uberis]|uniref:hypothetical protein n=1 Tax=Streptococcus uberis TaxID=1349 RepID=UPI00193A7F3F|nr:hypothetical protein [Streptococcus uberis]
MSLFDEVKELGDESYEKWFNRYFKKLNIEEKIKKSSAMGFNAYAIEVLSVKDPYIQRRLKNHKTIKLLKDRLGRGFNVKYNEYYSKNIFTKDEYVSDIKIIITW